MALPHASFITEQEYLALETGDTIKHEYAHGQRIAMTGASWAHNLICVNISTQLNLQLEPSDCRVIAHDMRLKVLSRVSYRYPDVMVVCGAPAFVGGRTDTLTNPVLIVEVLSDSTALIDRNEKLDEYLSIESLQAYLLVSQTHAKIERYLRQASRDWLYTHISGLDAVLALPSIQAQLALNKVYHGVTFTASE